MKLLWPILAPAMAFGFSCQSAAAPPPPKVVEPYTIEEGLISVSPERQLWARVYRGSSQGPAVVFINGLTQDADHWNSTLPEVLKTGATVLVYDAFHQGRTLREFASQNKIMAQLGQRPLLPPLLWDRQWRGHLAPLLPAATVQSQAQDLKVLIEKTLGSSKVVVVGLSYGGELNLEYAALDRDRVQAVVSLAPYVEPLAEQDQIIKTLIGNYRRINPFTQASEEDLYDFFLRILVLSSYHISEPSILKWGSLQPYANSELARGIRHSDAVSLAQQLKPGVFHLGVAGLDSYIQRPVLEKFWNLVPEEAKASFTVFEGVEHKINESVGPFLGSWIAQIVLKNQKLSAGLKWSAHPESGLVQQIDGEEHLNLQPTPICENILRPAGPGSVNLPIDRIARQPGEIFLHAMLSGLPRSWRDLSERIARFWGML